ncbi:monooxygenase 2 isoform X1 [Vigna angularis]|uniref:monooxygenase 2 isoform X1 n=1 Tax=Phaseolus angularis TaxID=3914 RepID=UPI000809DC09|nr:monooxygenase 2 isoform X1 [Vigna angularis]
MEREIVEDIVIVGAGIAGLTTSLGLHRLGIPSLVLESSDTLRVTGFALSIWQNAWKALDAVGVGDILRRQHLQLNGIVATSLVTGKQTAAIPFRATGNRKDIEIRCVKRKALLEALVNELPRGTIRYSSKVVGIEESGFYKILHLADGTTIKTKVLIGCDGVNSMVAKWLGFKKASFTGRYAIRGCAEVNSSHGLEPKFMQYVGKGFRAGVIPCDEKTVYWFFTWTPTSQVEKELKENPAQMKEYVLKKLENMASDVRYYIENTKEDAFLLAPLRYRNPWEVMMGNVSRGNVCVGGDAFHPMTPDLGQGGCCALEDGVILARCLAEAFSKEARKDGKEKEEEEEEEEQKRIEESLKKYAKERRWRSIDVIATAYVVGFIQQAESNLVSFLRDKVLASFLAIQLFKKSSYDCGKLDNS